MDEDFAVVFRDTDYFFLVYNRMQRNLAAMSAPVTRHKVAVVGDPTEVLCVGKSLQEAPENLVLFIPGNPGVASYYTSTMQSLYTLLGGTHAVWTVSHAGHCLALPSLWPGRQHVYDLEQQVWHKIAFIEYHVPRGTKLTLVGHSIGCHIILRLLNHFQHRPNVTISRTFMLFPTIERMKETPNGRKLWPVLCYLRWLVVLLAWAVSLLPGKLKDAVLEWHFGADVAPCCVGATRELLHARVVQNMLWMAHSELLQVVQLDVETVERHKNKIMLYYGASDGWCPQTYLEDMRTRVDGVQAVLCEDGSEHAFVLRHSRQTAEKLARWIKS
ncbi:Lipid droplet-associated hydrolase [Chionoecetes opilio]|uniref:Lipid droplet-associated hydrolase n=1 Tax=Chionoecetes opilio TaxID=41210 RepID=A0A8J4YD23_CHIOP|nr:Lipid droplet-associated hydrolase [Chionoecetes opilio]